MKWLLLALVVSGCGCARKIPVVVKPTTPTMSPLQKVYAATVVIETEDGCGSGALIGPNEVLTANHVIDGDEKIVLHFENGRALQAKVKLADKKTDLAVLWFDGVSGVAPVAVAEKAPASMSPVWNFGAPECQHGWASQGIWGVLEGHLRRFSGGLLWPGMSGGPVVDVSGAVIGVNDQLYRAESGALVPGMGLVVDLSAIKKLLTH